MNYLRISGIDDGMAMDKQLVAKNMTNGAWRSIVVATARFDREIIPRRVENHGTWHRLAISLTLPFLLHSFYAIQRSNKLSRVNFYCTFVPIESPCKLNSIAFDEATK